jgi:hypothetical protein
MRRNLTIILIVLLFLILLAVGIATLSLLGLSSWFTLA